MKGAKKAGETMAQYDASDKAAMRAAVKALHVLLCEEDGAWTAQGVEIDYAACGGSIEEATKNFGEGLALTIFQHLLIRGNLEKVLQFAPKEVLDEWQKTPPAAIQEIGFVAMAKAFQEAKVPQSEDVAMKFPYEGMYFIKPEPQKALAAA
jgi:hypothetical protein